MVQESVIRAQRIDSAALEPAAPPLALAFWPLKHARGDPSVAVGRPRWHRSRVPIRAILFDADGVLQGPAAEFETCLRAALGAASAPLDDFLHQASAAELL